MNWVSRTLFSALMCLSHEAISGAPESISPEARAEMDTILMQKGARSVSEAKVHSGLLGARDAVLQGQQSGGQPNNRFQSAQAFLKRNVSADATVKVVIHGDVTPRVLSDLKLAGATEVSSFPRYRSITARVPVTSVTALSSRPEVKSIQPFVRPVLNMKKLSPEEIKAWHIRYAAASLAGPITQSGSVSSQGVVAHAADTVHQTGITGQGQKVCVLSDGVDYMAASQASGDLPSSIDIVSGQGGTTTDNSQAEGTAMLEIVYDMAPSASLGFASGFNGDAQMATNIGALDTSKNCTVIVDDVTYFNEPPFQEGIIANAVTTVTGHGKAYFSSAGNSGNLLSGTSGTWEGDFLDGGPSTLSGESGTFHSFGSSIYNVLTQKTDNVILTWGDPQGASKNDYDLFVLDSSGAKILAYSTDTQNGSQNPYESVSGQFPQGSKIVVVKYNGEARALRLDTQRGMLSINTSGNTYGHNGGLNSITMAAVDVATAKGSVFSGGGANPVEYFSSDGPRRLFFKPVPSSLAITPNNILFSTNGGTLLSKVDFTAADGVSTTLPSSTYLNPFYGTSAAAPHAAAIAALIKSAKPNITLADLKAALVAGSLDVTPKGNLATTGSGIIRADLAVKSVLSPIAVAKSFSASSITANGVSRLSLSLTNSNQIALQGISLTDNYPVNLVNAASPNASLSGTGCLGTVSATGNGNALSLTGATIPAGVTCVLGVDVTSSRNGTYKDSEGQVTTPMGLNTPAVSATLLVGNSQNSLTLTATMLSIPVGGSSILKTSGGSGSGGISYSASTASGNVVCSISGDVLSAQGSGGACSVIATKAGDTDYAAISSSPLLISVGKAPKKLILSLNPNVVKVGGVARLNVSGGSGTGGLTYVSNVLTGSPVCSVSGNTVRVTGGAGSCSFVATKSADKTYLSVSSAPAVLRILKADQARLILSASAKSIKLGESVVLNVSGGSGTGSATYSATKASGKTTNCSLSGNILTISGSAGVCSVRAYKAADQAYNEIRSQVITISAK